jgi:hypothetical protein
MRKIDWTKALSEEDIAWLRTTGIVGIEDRIERHQADFDAKVPEDDTPDDETTRDALNPGQRAAEAVNTGNGPQMVDPTASDDQDDEDEGDDYESWKVGELETEVKARDEMPETTACVPEGTGANGNVTKPDLIAALRVWDRENPDAL